MKQAGILLLIFLLLLQSNLKLVTVAYYELRKEYISQNLCENRNKPELKCKGKCYLQNKIKSQEEQEKRIPSVLDSFNEIAFFSSIFEFSFSPSVTLVHNMFSFYKEKDYSSSLNAVFQPPRI